MQIPDNAFASHSASVEIDASPEAVFDLVSDLPRMGEWSPENQGGEWMNGGSGRAGDWFRGHNKSGEREWSRESEIVVAEPGAEFTFVVDGAAKNCTWWSYEMAGTAAGGTRLTERWWFVNKTPALQAATEDQLQARIAMTLDSMKTTLDALKATAEREREL